MNLVSDITKAVPFGLMSAALTTAAEVARAYETEPAALAEAFGVRPSINVLPYEAPYGPWWVIQITAGAEVAFIAN